MAGGSKGWRRRCTCPQLHPSLSCPAWPVTPVGSSPSLHGLYVSCHCHPLLSSPGQGTAGQKVRSVIKTRGHRGPSGGGPSPPQKKKKKTSIVMSATSCTPKEMHGDKWRSSLAGTLFQLWWHFFCGVLDRACSYSHIEVGQGFGRQEDVYSSGDFERL